MKLVSVGARMLPDGAFVRAIAYAHRRFEPEMARIVAACPRECTALDVGAWYGPWTYWLARRVASVVTFEPNPEVADVLERTIAPNVRLIRAAASDRAGTAKLALPAGGFGLEGRASLESQPGGGRQVEVDTCRLDDLELGNVGFAKIDVEGHERAVLAGAAGLIERHRPMLVVEVEQRHGGIEPTVALLAGWGYRGRLLVEHRWVPLDDFDLAGYQERFYAEREPASYLATMLPTKHRYLNNVVFTHESAQWNIK
jgi:FkbM family methyltransferase